MDGARGKKKVRDKKATTVKTTTIWDWAKRTKEDEMVSDLVLSDYAAWTGSSTLAEYQRRVGYKELDSYERYYPMIIVASLIILGLVVGKFSDHGALRSMLSSSSFLVMVVLTYGR